MKYFSEKLNKTFDTPEECMKAEEEFEAKEKETKAVAESKKKKELVKAIEESEEKLDKAYAEYELAKKNASDIVKKANIEAREILSKAEDVVAQASNDRINAISEFNKNYGEDRKSVV